MKALAIAQKFMAHYRSAVRELVRWRQALKDPPTLENADLRQWAFRVSDQSADIYFEVVAEMLIRVRDLTLESVKLRGVDDLVSPCCKAPVRIASTGWDDVGNTNWYKCSKCGNAVDPIKAEHETK